MNTRIHSRSFILWWYQSKKKVNPVSCYIHRIGQHHFDKSVQMTYSTNENKRNSFIPKSMRVEVQLIKFLIWRDSKMESILIDPLNHTKTSDLLTPKKKKKCLQFFRAKSELLDGIKSMFSALCLNFFS